MPRLRRQGFPRLVDRKPATQFFCLAQGQVPAFSCRKSSWLEVKEGSDSADPQNLTGQGPQQKEKWKGILPEGLSQLDFFPKTERNWGWSHRGPAPSLGCPRILKRWVWDQTHSSHLLDSKSPGIGWNHQESYASHMYSLVLPPGTSRRLKWQRQSDKAHFANCKARVEMSDGIMVMPNPSKTPGVNGSYSWTQWLKP